MSFSKAHLSHAPHLGPTSPLISSLPHCSAFRICFFPSWFKNPLEGFVGDRVTHGLPQLLALAGQTRRRRSRARASLLDAVRLLPLALDDAEDIASVLGPGVLRPLDRVGEVVGHEREEPGEPGPFALAELCRTDPRVGNGSPEAIEVRGLLALKTVAGQEDRSEERCVGKECR